MRNFEGPLTPSFLSVCRASLDTLTHLSVVVLAHKNRELHLDPLFSIHFPRLCSLEIGPSGYDSNYALYDNDSEKETIARGFVQFLSRHPGITRLRLLYECADDEGASDHFLPLPETFDSTTVDILPRLTHLDAHPEQISIFAKNRVRFFQHLNRLEVTDGLCWEAGPLMENMFKECMLYSIGIAQSFGVRHIQLRLRTEGTDDLLMYAGEFTQAMEWASQAFPKLLTWEGDVPDADSLERVSADPDYPCCSVLTWFLCHFLNRSMNLP